MYTMHTSLLSQRNRSHDLTNVKDKEEYRYVRENNPQPSFESGQLIRGVKGKEIVSSRGGEIEICDTQLFGHLGHI
jgi:hypothetical protein